ncbi:MAG: CRISPR-associated protein Cas4 [bacterium]
MLTLTISDIEQYLYCPRLVFFDYIQPVREKSNGGEELEHEQIAESLLEKVESRRKLRAFHLDKGKREFRPLLTSPKLGLRGKVDLVIRSKEGIFPVQFHQARPKAPKSILYHLAAYSLLLEDHYGISVNKGFIYVMPIQDVHIHLLTEELKDEVLTILASIREMIFKERFPEQTRSRSRCHACGCQNFCADIW